MSDPSYRDNIFFEHAPDPIAVTSPEGMFIDVNRRFEEESGYERQTLVGRHVIDSGILTAASAELVLAELNRLKNEPAPIDRFEIEAVTRSGTIAPYELNASVIADADGRPTAIQAIFRNIGRRKQVENDLREVQEFLAGVINAVPDPLFVKNRDHRWVLINEAFCAFIGHSRDELIGKSDYDFFPTDEATVFWEKDNEVFDTGVPNVNTEVLTDADRRQHVIVTRKQRFTLPTSGKHFLVGTIRPRDRRSGGGVDWSKMGQRLRKIIERD